MEILFKQKSSDQRNKEPNWLSVCDNLYVFMQLEFQMLSDSQRGRLADLEHAFHSSLMHATGFSLVFGGLAHSHLGRRGKPSLSLTLQPVLLAQRAL